VCRFDDAGERHRLPDCEIRKLLSIKLDPSGIKPVDEARVTHAVRTRSRVDSAYPQTAEIPLAAAAVTVCKPTSPKH
jgi:hypothetical protein